MKILSIILLALTFLSLPAVAQRPEPYVAVSGVIRGSGYTPFALTSDAGILYDSQRFFTFSEATYTTGGKKNDNDNTTTAGHSRSLRGEYLVKFNHWEIGPGATWSKTYTPEYAKSAVHPKATAGRDFGHVNFFASYLFQGTDRLNGLTGFETQAWWKFGRHLFVRNIIDVYRFHATLTDTGNAALTKAESSNKSTSGAYEIQIGWRF